MMDEQPENMMPDDVEFTEADIIEPINDDTIEDNIQTAQQEMAAFERLTLAEALSEFTRQPRYTVQMLQRVASSRRQHRPIFPNEKLTPDTSASNIHHEVESETASDELVMTSTEQELVEHDKDVPLSTSDRQKLALILGFQFSAILLAWSGNTILRAASDLPRAASIIQGLVFIGLAMVAWVGITLFAGQDEPPAKVSTSKAQDNDDTPDAVHPEFKPTFWERIQPIRLILAGIGLIATILTVIFTSNNQFTLVGFWMWMVSIAAFAGSIASDKALFESHQFGKIPPFWKKPSFWAFAMLFAVAAFFRLYQLDQTPPQMTSDHVEKLLDSQRVLEGNLQVFFPNNGGREPLQMYLMAILSNVPGLGMDFTTLKLLSALEGLLTLPFLWWMAREVIGKEQRQLGNIVGLVLVGLVAVSHWHVALSRLALRIILTPLMAAWLLIFLGRGMRQNERDDFLKAGLILGAGLYMYQAVRMLPVVVIVGVLIAIVMRSRSWRAFQKYALNFASLVFISFIVFVPMFSFSMQYPDLFWRRTTGRLLGDAIVQEVQADGSILTRDATLSERLAAFQDNMPVLNQNIQDVLLMFHWRGDVAWINNAPNVPHMDTLAGALFFLGLAAWLLRIIRRRDVVDVLVPLMLFIMLMPSALAIAYPVENPSATRTSGALPVAYLLAAYPLGQMLFTLRRLLNRRILNGLVATLILSSVMLISYLQNSHTYFQKYHDNYLLSSLPYKQAGEEIAAFNADMGTDGNTFMIAYPYWWDHRAIGLEARLVDYPNGIINLESVPQFLSDSTRRGDRYRFNPERDILFFHAAEDEQTREQLQVWFPNGISRIEDIPEQMRQYAVYRVPAIGQAAFDQFIQTYVTEQTADN